MKHSGLPRVFLVDDHPMVREGLVHLFSASGFVVVGQAENSRGLLTHPALKNCDLLLLDLSLGEESGIDLIRPLIDGGIRVVVYSMHEGSNSIRHAFTAGAHGFVTKRESPQVLLAAIQTVLAGREYRSPRVEAILSDTDPAAAVQEDAVPKGSSPSAAGLSRQQQQLYDLLGHGCTNEEIARRLGISIRTLESYCVRIVNKLGLQGIKELRQHAIRAARPS